uniref:RING-type E3 ubiquitin transferase n=1 Tax=Aureoumbra lagunensis TaxID=44058 RepID=A0A7S3NIV3_9STRA|mmetsp:Transcript_1139/g.1431  ORF Transcript_1139/g.1431 Transcript_1139/m.1431 type:complete len:250 (-) Transcript_1139:387-1136(-)
MTTCILNESLPVINYSCANGANAYACSCDISVTCCARMDCPECYESSDSDQLFSFSWPLVAGWYIMLVILFCLGRRGRVGDHLCWMIGWRRSRRNGINDNHTEGSDTNVNHTLNENGDIEFTPVVKTRKVEEDDLNSDEGEAPVCTICLNQLQIDDIVANLDCPHLYHEECILPWLRRKATCPLCAVTIDLENRGTPSDENRTRSGSRLLTTRRISFSTNHEPEQRRNIDFDDEDEDDNNQPPIVTIGT